MNSSLRSSVQFIGLLASLLLAIMVIAPAQAEAQVNGFSSTIELEGFAWSSTVGWISMNCTNTSTCATNGGYDYSVELNGSTGNITGYAWSSNVGWIRFGGLSGFPSSGSNARATGDITGNVNLTGWARACAVYANPNNCSGSLDPDRGGWDGWIALRNPTATGPAYGVTLTSTGATANSYAWGGPIVMGWIDFSPTGADPVGYAELPSDLILGAVNTQLIGPNAAGYDEVEFTFSVSDVPVTAVNVPYVITLDAQSDLTGTFNGNASGVVNVTASFTNVPYGATPLNWTVTVDAPAPGEVNEGGGAAELNEANGTLDIAAPNPTIVVTLPDFVRSGETVEVEVTVDAPYVTTCQIFGAGFSSASQFTTTAGVTYSDTPTSPNAITNSTNIVVQCSVPGASPFSESSAIEVIPTFQEI